MIEENQGLRGRLGSDEPTALAPPSGVKPASGLEQSRSSTDAVPNPPPIPNQPAFPPAITVSAAGDVYHGYDGMTLRDWFAGQALPAMIAGSNEDATCEQLALWSYGLAEAMLAERGRCPQ